MKSKRWKHRKKNIELQADIDAEFYGSLTAEDHGALAAGLPRQDMLPRSRFSDKLKP